MFAIRCTKKLIDRVSPKALPSPVPPSTVLGDWYANLVFTRPEQYIVCISERTLLPVVVTAKDAKNLPGRLADATAEVLMAIGLAETDIDEEITQMRSAYFAKTADRRVLGSLNDFVFHFEHGTGSDLSVSILERTLRMARMPCGAIEYAYPSEAALAAFAARKVMKAASSAA